MPTDFTAYTDPGIYIEMVDPPVNNTTSITDTVVALVGAAGEEGRQITSSTVLRSQYSSTLSAKGINPFSLKVRSRLTLEQYMNAAFGVVTEGVTSAGTATLTVSARDDFDLPESITNADFNDFKLMVDNRVYNATLTSSSSGTYVFSISGLGATPVSVINEGAVVNLYAPYVDPVQVGTLRADALAEQDGLNAGRTQFNMLQNKKAIQKVRVLKSSSDTDIVYGSGTASLGTLTLKAAGTFKTAAAVAEQLTAVKATVKKYETGTGTASFVNYVIAFGIDNPLLTSESSDVVITKRGIEAGDLLLIDRERILVDAIDVVSSGENDTEIVKLDVVRAVDGTTAASHGKADVYLTSGYDYAVTIDAGDDSLINGVDDLTILSTVAGGRLAPFDEDGAETVYAESVEVRAYSTDAKQYAPESFTDLDDVKDKYGLPIVNGLVASSLTFAAQLAFRNGAERIYCVSVATNDIEGFEDAIDKLAGIEEVNVIVPITTGFNIAATESVASKLSTFCTSQAAQGNLVRGFIGIDGNINLVEPTDFWSLAQRISDFRMTVVAPSRFVTQTSAGRLTVGGQFAAAAVSGLHAGLEVQNPLTRKELEASLRGIDDMLTGKEMLELQSKGVLVLSQERNRRIMIRHGLTTDMTSLYSREISIMASRDRLRDLIFNSLTRAKILGSPITANTPELVVSNITGALEIAKRATLIFDYADVKYRIPANNPTAIEVRFAYRPTMPLNYILVEFSVDTTSSAVTFQSITQGGI